MDDTLLSYALNEGIATITLDDGKANVMSLRRLQALDAALRRAATDKAAVVLTGRPGVFSGGFDLNVFKQGSPRDQHRMLEAGARITETMLSFPLPLVVACTGHAIAMGVFVLLSGDVRLGVDTPGTRIQANEVQIGLTLPRFAIEVLRQRLSPAQLGLTAITARPYTPQEAVAAGFLDVVVGADELATAARATASRLLQLNLPAYTATKLRLREPVLAALRQAIVDDTAEWSARLGPTG